MSNEIPKFSKPINWLTWIPVAIGGACFGAYLRDNPGLSWSWLAVGGGLGYFGHLFGTDKVKSYRVFQEYLRGKNLGRHERLEILREADSFFPHIAIHSALVEDLLREGAFKEAFPILENLRYDELSEESRTHFMCLRATVLFELGYLERAEFALAKVLGEAGAYLPALALKKRMDANASLRRLAA